MSKQTERFNYKGGCGVCQRMHIEEFKRRSLAWAIDKWLQVVSNKMLFNTVMPLRNKRKSRFKFKTILYALLCDR